MLRILRIEARFHGVPEGGLPGNLLIVANHISWLDIFVLLALSPARFVGEGGDPALARRRPAVRQRRHAVRRARPAAPRASINREAATALARGDIVAIFPEGTTTDGTTLLPFKSSLLQPIVDAEGHVQPVAIRYSDPDGAPSDAPAYVGETSFVASFWRVTAEPALVAEAHMAGALSARARDRRELAREAEDVIRTVLASPARGSVPGRRGDRAA